MIGPALPPPAAPAAIAVAACDLEREVRALLDEDPTLHLVDLTASGGHRTDPPLRGVYQLRSAAGDRIQLTAAGAGELPGLAHIWAAADWPEREAAERFGIRFTGREDLRPLMLAAPATAPGEGPPPSEGEVPIHDPALGTPFRLDLGARLRGGRIISAEARPGRLHSGFEKLAEGRTYAQLPVLAESLNEQAPFAAGLAAVLAAEALLEIEPPPRCTWVRTLLAEVSRIAAHCAWLANLAGPDSALWGQSLAARESAARFLAAASGRRWATGAQRIGGIAADVPAEADRLLGDLRSSVDRLRSEAERSTVDHRGWRRRFTGVAVLEAAGALAGGASGPVARASGIALDVRRTDPYLAYGEVRFRVPTADSGDVVDRTRVRLEEMGESVAIARQCLAAGPAGSTLAHETPQPTVRPTEPAELIRHFERWMDGHGHRPRPSEVYVPIESADGELAFYLVSDGSGSPARVHLRSPSLFHFQVLPPLLAGLRYSRAPQVVASLNVIASEMDR